MKNLLLKICLCIAAMLASAPVSATILLFSFTGSGSGATQTFSFTAPSSPVPTLFSATAFAIPVSNLTYLDSNGFSFSGADIVGFDSANGFGLGDVPGQNFFDLGTSVQLFTGTLAAPTFITGTFAASGNVGPNGRPQFSIGTLSISQVASGVPEPATWAMMLVGFGAVAFGMRWQKRAETLPQSA